MAREQAPAKRPVLDRQQPAASSSIPRGVGSSPGFMARPTHLRDGSRSDAASASMPASPMRFPERSSQRSSPSRVEAARARTSSSPTPVQARFEERSPSSCGRSNASIGTGARSTTSRIGALRSSRSAWATHCAPVRTIHSTKPRAKATLSTSGATPLAHAGWCASHRARSRGGSRR